MNKVQTFILLSLTVTILVVGAIAVGATPDTGGSVEQAPPINDTTRATDALNPASTTSSQQYSVTATGTAEINQGELARYGTVGTQADRRIELKMPPSNVTAVERLPWVIDVRPTVRPVPADIPGSSDGGSLGVESLHEQGVTGDGVQVGIIDGGFDRNEIDGNIQSVRSFRDTRGDPAHGTGVAEVVTQTAPDSQLYLASAGSVVDTAQAIDYLVNQNVDIIVYSNSIPAYEDDGEHFLTDNIRSARQQGTLFVNSAGNNAELHWEGNFRDTNSDTQLEWDISGDEQNALPNQNTAFSGGRVTVYIRWDETGASSRYRAALYNPNTGQYVAVGRDRAFDAGTNRYSKLDTTVQSQPLTLVIENTAGPADDEIEVVVTDGPRKIERNIPSSSIGAPADVSAAVSVGAYERGSYVQQSGMAPYSSRGPTDDGRIGIDVTGYTNIDVNNRFYGLFSGTSAAAPYVGGVAALVEERHQGDASPTEIETALNTTSDDIRSPGADTVSGAGVVNAVESVSAATSTVIQNDDRVFQGQDGLVFASGDDTLTGISGDAEGQVLSIPIPQDQTTGQYSSDGTLSTFTIIVAQPRISDFEILNNNGDDIASGSVSDANAQNLTVAVEYNYGVYEGLEITVEDPNGLEVQNDVVSSSTTSSPAGAGTNTVTFEVNLSDEDAGTYILTAEGEDNLNFGSATQSTTLELTAGDGNAGMLSAQRSLSADQIPPGGEVTVSLEATAQDTAVTFTESFAPAVNSSSINQVTVNGDEVSPIVAAANQDGVVVTIDSLQSGETVTASYTISVTEDATAGDSIEIVGNVSSGSQSATLEPGTLLVSEGSPLDGPAAEYDKDADGDITISELGSAATDFAGGNLSITELGSVAAAFAS